MTHLFVKSKETLRAAQIPIDYFSFKRLFSEINPNVDEGNLNKTIFDFILFLIEPTNYDKQNRFIWKGNEFFGEIEGYFE